MDKKIKITIIIILLIIFAIAGFLIFPTDNIELKTVKSESELHHIYDGDNTTIKNIVTNIITMPFSFVVNVNNDTVSQGILAEDVVEKGTSTEGNIMPNSVTSDETASSKDYSTTNIQVENVDEADIIKTDGDYIYSISENKVVITNVVNPEDIKIEATIELKNDTIPEELILYKNELVVISSKSNNASNYSYYNKNDTIVEIYDIATKSKPILLKNYELYEPYYTSRCINNKLYVIASGTLREDDDKIIRNYKEDNNNREIALENIKYLRDVKTRKQTIISMLDLNDAKADIEVNSYLIDISNAYISEHNIYLLDQKYEEISKGVPPISKLFGLKGIIGVFTDYDEYEYSGEYQTEIYKFEISSNGNVYYKSKAKIEGRTINQYSLDEQNGHLRVAIYDDDGARIVIFDENLQQIGTSKYVAEGETMYSSRFIGNKVYLVTYKTVDPLFVIDLSNETNPKVLGELHIPGYSTYLHPYDENHLIGIGMESEEVVNRNSSGRVTSTTARITGMKMALFDITDVNNPIQISETIIGDSRTTSAILTNPKALLFSKEREIIAIPVNNYKEDFAISTSSDTYLSMVNAYTQYDKSYVAEGYFVYKINLENGFKLKGIITHEAPQKNKNSYYYYNSSKLLRGLYIEDNLYTVSETAIKVNNLDTLELVDELKIEDK